jgi:hypothetical protein
LLASHERGPRSFWRSCAASTELSSSRATSISCSTTMRPTRHLR